MSKCCAGLALAAVKWRFSAWRMAERAGLLNTRSFSTPSAPAQMAREVLTQSYRPAPRQV
eukprot:10865839-Alexandrium_andersonii.AAC.1